jgi:glyoxylase-like metal-dependent hydrolase (beta-lactamase superfamily II)
MEIAPGIHAVEEVRGSNAILLAGERMAIVDTGYAGNCDAIVRGIKAIGRSPRDLAWIILTHHHLDHSGTAAELHELTGAPVVAHGAETEPAPDGGLLLRKGTERQHIPIWYRWLIRGFRAPPTPPPLFPNTIVHQTVEHGDLLPCLEGVRILHTPGHTPGSICLVVDGPQTSVFLGDSVINNRSRLSRPLMWDRGARQELDASLRSLRPLEANVALFGHGPPLNDEVMPRLRGLTDQPYDLPTWRIVLKNWRTLRRFHQTNRRPGGWLEGVKETRGEG